MANPRFPAYPMQPDVFRQRLHEHGIQQKTFALLMGVNTNSVWRWCTDRLPPRYAVLALLAYSMLDVVGREALWDELDGRED